MRVSESEGERVRVSESGLIRFGLFRVPVD